MPTWQLVHWQEDRDGAAASIAKAINDSSADDPLCFVIVGPNTAYAAKPGKPGSFISFFYDDSVAGAKICCPRNATAIR